MAKSITITFLKQNTSDLEGTLYIRITEDRISKRKSLGIKVKESDWVKFFNPKIQRFKSDKRFPAAAEINIIISSKLQELSKNYNELAYLPDEKKSFTKYWEKYIGTIENYGTRIKHEGVYTKLKKFLIANSKTGLLFVEITPNFLRELKLYFTKASDPKTLSTNSVNHYLKIIKSIINNAAKDDYYVFGKDPFVTLNFTNKVPEKNILSAQELTYIMKTMFWENPDMDLTRDMFLFQIFANGMRVSDLLLLRWNNFEKRRLSYTMFKTSHFISIPVNPNLATILHVCLESTETYDNLIDIFSQEILDEYGNILKLKFSEIESRIKGSAYHELEVTELKKENLMKEVNEKTTVIYKDYYFNKKDDVLLINLIDAREKLLGRIDDLYVSSIFSQIKKKKERNLNDFVFPILKNEDFKNIDEKNDFKKISRVQYNIIKHAIIVYNRKLKKLQQSCGVNTTLKSHVARHSFTNLTLTMKDINLYDLSQALGHSSITITQNYIKNGFNPDKVDYINTEISKQFKKKI